MANKQMDIQTRGQPYRRTHDGYDSVLSAILCKKHPWLCNAQLFRTVIQKESQESRGHNMFLFTKSSRVALPRIKCINLKLTSDGGEAVLKSRESIEELTVQKEVLTSASPQFRNVVPLRKHQRIVSKICHILAWHCSYLLEHDKKWAVCTSGLLL